MKYYPSPTTFFCFFLLGQTVLAAHFSQTNNCHENGKNEAQKKKRKRSIGMTKNPCIECHKRHTKCSDIKPCECCKKKGFICKEPDKKAIKFSSWSPVLTKRRKAKMPSIPKQQTEKTWEFISYGKQSLLTSDTDSCDSADTTEESEENDLFGSFVEENPAPKVNILTTSSSSVQFDTQVSIFPTLQASPPEDPGLTTPQLCYACHQPLPTALPNMVTWNQQAPTSPYGALDPYPMELDEWFYTDF